MVWRLTVYTQNSAGQKVEIDCGYHIVVVTPEPRADFDVGGGLHRFMGRSDVKGQRYKPHL